MATIPNFVVHVTLAFKKQGKDVDRRIAIWELYSYDDAGIRCNYSFVHDEANNRDGKHFDEETADHIVGLFKGLYYCKDASKVPV